MSHTARQPCPAPVVPSVTVASNVVPLRPKKPFRFSPDERAALLALPYIYPVTTCFSRSDDGGDHGSVIPDEESPGRGASTILACPAETGGIVVTDVIYGEIGTFWTAADLMAAVREHLDALGYAD